MRKFSILLPTFNRAHLINRTIKSILDQDYSNWELIIQNGGESIAHLMPNDERIKLFEEKDTGITDAMNKAMSKATGDIFCWSNDDDELLPETLKWVDENLIAKWGYGLITMTDGVQSFYWGRIDDGATFEQLIEGNFVPQPGVYWTRGAYETVGPMDESLDLTSDYEYWLRLWKNYTPQKFKRIMALYHLHDEQITKTRTTEQINQAKKTSEKYAR